MYLCLSATSRRFGSCALDGERTNGVRSKGNEGTLVLFEARWRHMEVISDGFVPLRVIDSVGTRIRVCE